MLMIYIYFWYININKQIKYSRNMAYSPYKRPDLSEHQFTILEGVLERHEHDFYTDSKKNPEGIPRISAVDPTGDLGEIVDLSVDDLKIALRGLENDFAAAKYNPAKKLFKDVSFYEINLSRAKELYEEHAPKFKK
jgi:hypothetical protein